MRVRTQRQTAPTIGRPRRRHQAARPEASAPPPAAPAPEGAEDQREERRARASGGPIDRACYSCTCGYVFDAAVSTSVACPHCGTGQAW